MDFQSQVVSLFLAGKLPRHNIYLPRLGTFEYALGKVNSEIKFLIRMKREHPSTDISKVPTLWVMRRTAQRAKYLRKYSKRLPK